MSNSASNAGGAIFVERGTLIVNTSSFINNTAWSSSLTSYASGGALSVEHESSNVTVLNSTFVTNSVRSPLGGCVSASDAWIFSVN